MSAPATRILCATDLSARCDDALERAGLLAESLAADLTLLHVVHPSRSDGGLEAALLDAERALRTRAAPPRWRSSRLPDTVIGAGSPGRAIVAQLARAPCSDLLVLGSGADGTISDLLDGSIAEKAIAARRCPVLVVRTRPSGPYRSVLLALDVSASSAAAARAAERLVLAPETRATVVHVGEPPYEGMLGYGDVGHEPITAHVRHWRASVRQALGDLLAGQTRDPGRFALHVEHGHTVRGIVAAVRTHAPDLLVVGTRGGGRLHRALLGSVANSVVRRVATDVLIVPAPSRADAPRVRFAAEFALPFSARSRPGSSPPGSSRP